MSVWALEKNILEYAQNVYLCLSKKGTLNGEVVWITEALKTASGQLMDTCLCLACASGNNAQTSWHISPLTREVDAIVFSARTSQNPSQRLILRRVTGIVATRKARCLSHPMEIIRSYHFGKSDGIGMGMQKHLFI